MLTRVVVPILIVLPVGLMALPSAAISRLRETVSRDPEPPAGVKTTFWTFDGLRVGDVYEAAAPATAVTAALARRHDLRTAVDRAT